MLTPQPARRRARPDHDERRICRWDLYTRQKTKQWFADYLPGGCGEVGLKVMLPTHYCAAPPPPRPPAYAHTAATIQSVEAAAAPPALDATAAATAATTPAAACVDAALHMALGRTRSSELCGGGEEEGGEVEVQYFGEVRSFPPVSRLMLSPWRPWCFGFVGGVRISVVRGQENTMIPCEWAAAA